MVGSCIIKHLTTKFTTPFPYSFLLLTYGIFIGILAKYVFLNEEKEIIYTWSHTDPHSMLMIFVPPLIYESSFNIDYHIFKKYLWHFLFLTIPGVIFSTAITGLVVKSFETSFDWISCFILGSILSATDPIAVINILQNLGVSKKLLILIEGESLLNDGTAYTVFVLLKYGVNNTITFPYIVETFSQLTFGGIVFGIFMGFLFNNIIKRIYDNNIVELSFSIVSCYITFYISEHLLHLSGILSIVSHGLYISYTGRTGTTPSLRTTLEHLWEFLSYVINNIIFVLAGVIIFLNVSYDNIHGSDIGYLFILYICLNICRIILVSFLYIFFRKIGYGLSKMDAIILSLSGLRGEITLLLSLIVKLEFELSEEIKDKICFYSFGIVILTILVNSSIVKFITNKYISNNKQEELLDEQILHIEDHLSDLSDELIYEMKQNEFFLKANWEKITKQFLTKVNNQNEDIELQIQNDNIENRPVLMESKKIFLQCLKKQYWNLFDRHMIYKDVVVKLIELIDNVLDSEDLDWSLSIDQYCCITSSSCFENFFYKKISKCCFGKCIQIYNIKHHYNIVEAYIMGQREVLTKLSNLITDNEIFEELEKYSNKSEERGIKFLKQIETAYPKLVKEIETNQVTYLILKNQEKYLKELFNNGEISDKLYNKFNNKIHKKEYMLHL
jgi:NhaP-type Na+/H+ or K+/H+ antiporter|tara:strand:+ start:1409 stop:3424 length:2016 start_codon:yes stop_codon:yes gene_type:complete